ncbi:mannose-6-phosphate isomerase, class I [Aneurinibacillus terranovensis]|uniref:mannose-6-phosphate isomerase, class I n=1 Tax=Aneurinibacillus terranovensis TaxID=278991 RepID=UPI00048527C8|nr:mannose-6-phosphate isomerase, class I [Aneurinibacillus terranovensis]
MEKEPLFLQPVFKEKIWGGDALQKKFGYQLPSAKTGECWAISAHPHGQSTIKNGAYQGKTLGELWEKHREVFGNESGDKFPLLTKILDANDDLSVQVHPNDDYAKKHENGELGKTECWYIIDCKEDAELIFGHTARTTDELRQKIEHGEWDSLLRTVNIKPGDFFYVPSGTIHALKEGTLVLETQQNSDTTYRVYDYARRDDQGNLRDLHIEKSIAVTTVPHKDVKTEKKVEQNGGLRVTTFVEADYFAVYKWEVEGKATLEQKHKYLLVSVLEGEGKIEKDRKQFGFQKGDHFILPYGFGVFTLAGKAKMIISRSSGN